MRIPTDTAKWTKMRESLTGPAREAFDQATFEQDMAVDADRAYWFDRGGVTVGYRGAPEVRRLA
jgi:hypothetical protein